MSAASSYLEDWQKLVQRGSRVLDRPANANRIVAWTVEGKTSREVVAMLAAERKVNVTPQAVQGFLRRHQPMVDALTAKIAEAIDDIAIKDKEERIRRLAGLYDRMDEIVETRGLIATDIKITGGGKYQERVEVERFDAALVKEMRATLADVADELGDRPKTPLIDNRTVNITVLDVVKAASDG